MNSLLEKIFLYIKQNAVLVFKKILLGLFSTVKDVLSKYFLFLLKTLTVVAFCYFVLLSIFNNFSLPFLISSNDFIENFKNGFGLNKSTYLYSFVSTSYMP